MSDDRESPITLRRPMLPAVAAEKNGTLPQYDDRYEAKNEKDDGRPFITPRNAVEISANCAFRAEHAALESSEWAGKCFAEAATTRRLGEGNATELKAIKADVATVSEKVDRLEVTIGEVAKAVGARRTFSGTVHVSVPPASPIEIKTTKSTTGEHQRISQAEIDRLVGIMAALETESRERAAQARTAEAEERGARDALAAVEAEKAEMLAEEDRRHKRSERLRNLVLAGIAIVSATYGGIEWLLAHVH